MSQAIELKVRLTYTQPPSNKEYRLELVRDGAGWVVNFAYGRIGSALKTGAKTNAPTDYATARKIYERQLASKVNEGYVLDTTTQTQDYQAPTAKEDTGLRPQLLEPITLEQADAFINSEAWCMQPKYDGNRVFIIVANATAINGANRKGQKISLPLDVVRWAQAKLQIGRVRSFTFDGELVGEMYFVFDLLELNGKPLSNLPYRTRLSLLWQMQPSASCIQLADTAKSEMDKLALLDRLQRERAEGAVFKKMDAPYVPGRNATQVKCKFWESASFIVKAQNVGVRSIELGLLASDGITVESWGNCTVPSNYALPEVGAIVEVKYLYVDDNVYQPQYKGERTDLDRSACLVGQLKFKPGARRARLVGA